MYTYRDSSGAIRFKPTKEETEKQNLLNEIDSLNKKYEFLEKRIKNIENVLDVFSETNCGGDK